MKVFLILAGLLLTVSFCKAQKLTGSDVASGFIRPESFGANPNDEIDDSPAINKAVAYAMKLPGISGILFGSGTYIIDKDIVVDYRGKGQLTRKGIFFQGTNSTIYLKGGGFNILADIKGQQDTKFSFKNFYFYTNNVTRPNGIYIESASFTDISDCIFERCATAVFIKNSGMNSISNCKFWGCINGIKTYRVRDTYVDRCHAYACDWGFMFEGVNDSGSDGNITLSNSVANACTKANVTFTKVYAPVITGLTSEQSPKNLCIISSQFGTLANSFFGPPKDGDYGIEFLQNGMSNDYWTISNINVQGRIRFDGFRSGSISNLSEKLVRDNRQDHAIVFRNSAYLTLSAINIREVSGPYSILFESGSDHISMNNFLLEKPVLVKGDAYSIQNGFIRGGIETGTGKYGKLMDLDFTDDTNWKRTQVSKGVMR